MCLANFIHLLNSKKLAKFKKVNISAINGQYITAAEAKRKPNTTVRMTVKVGKRS